MIFLDFGMTVVFAPCFDSGSSRLGKITEGLQSLLTIVNTNLIFKYVNFEASETGNSRSY
jgi:hypothetical protein